MSKGKAAAAVKVIKPVVPEKPKERTFVDEMKANRKAGTVLASAPAERQSPTAAPAAAKQKK